MKLKAGTIKRLHVDRHIVAKNVKQGRRDPAITVQTSKGSHKASRVFWDGPSFFVQAGVNPTIKPLNCGARLWIETKAEVILG